MSKPKNNMRRVSDLVIDTNSRWKRIRLTLIEIACVLSGIFLFCYALHVVEGIA